MAVAGALIGGALNAYGKKPKIPELPQLDLTTLQKEAVQGNLAALPGAQELATGVNAFNQSQAIAMAAKALEFALPGGLGQAQGIVRSQLAGELSPDVSAQVMRQSAAQAAGGGFGGSILGRNLSLRDLGLTSMQQQQQGIGNLQALAGLVPQAPQFDITSMFFSAQQRLQFAFDDRSARFNRDLLAAQVKAAPDPATAALGREIDRFFNTAAGAGMTAAGGVG